MNELLDFLDVVVPLQILEWQRNGGISEEQAKLAVAEYLEFIEIPSNVDVAARRAIGEKATGRSILWSKVANSLAVLAFQPGGVKFGGRHYTAV